ncbi:oxidoreductase [Xylanimonas oleitrophica]|uniref:Oxidoreductase n=1 Tax=Xylanimonas oleitrophica TaxID=2607479 RepID=A0A2W5WNI2_9MICO|nr:SDR family NAD(P)-dependent oxidoreductase [Xylanimonas oleitrophica]PZR53099.1 oxidoreductase [Xylanimonas oleitrophica]
MAGTNRVAVVTGASSGIGLEIARELIDKGFDVIVTAEDAGLTAAAQELALTGSRVDAVQADLTTREGLDSLVEAVHAVGRPVDALVLNAGVANAGPFVETPLEGDLEVVALNVTAVVYLAKKLVPPMVERGEGAVLVTSSVAGTMPGPWYATYAASKAFELSFAEAVRHELKDTGVTVTALVPGPTDTEFFEDNDMEDLPVGQGPKDDPVKVAKEAVKGLLKGDDKVVVRSFKAKMQAATGAVLPPKAQAAVHASTTKPPEKD